MEKSFAKGEKRGVIALEGRRSSFRGRMAPCADMTEQKEPASSDVYPKSWTLLSLGLSQFVNADAARYLAGGIHFVFDLILLLL